MKDEINCRSVPKYFHTICPKRILNSALTVSLIPCFISHIFGDHKNKKYVLIEENVMLMY